MEDGGPHFPACLGRLKTSFPTIMLSSSQVPGLQSTHTRHMSAPWMSHPIPLIANDTAEQHPGL